MYHKVKKGLAAGLAAAMLLSQAAYADNIVTAQQPSGTESGSYISGTGPTGTKELSDKGYLVVGANGNENAYVNAGPGVSGSVSGTGTNSDSNGGQTTIISGGNGSGTTEGAAPSAGEAGTGAAGTASGQITIDASIAKPEIASEAGVLYDATTGQVLFGKEQDKALYPASTTKLMTALLAAEKLSLSDTVTYSASATEHLESGASNVNLVAGDKLSVEDSLYALLLKSACEVANGLAEKVAGSQEAFVSMMNARAKELGCKNTSFANPSGLNNENHHTSVYDMALITKAALANDAVRKIDQTLSYTLPASQKRGTLQILNGHKMLNPANSQYYKGVIGGKTGYTSKAGNTLATAANLGGHELIAVVFNSKQKQYEDTKALFDYGTKLLSAAGSGSAAGGSTAASGTTSAGSEGWVQVSDTEWQYRKSDGTFCKSEWLDLSTGTYWFDDNTYMATGWRHFSNNAWYYFNPQNGTMVTEKWVTENGKSYYMQKDGTMAVSTVINDTYQVDENGVYVKKLK